MEPAARVVSGTFNGDPVGLAAAGAVLGRYESEDVVAKLWATGAGVVKIIRAELDAAGRLFEVVGWDVHPRIVPVGGEGREELMSLFVQETLRAGLVIHHAGFNAARATAEPAALRRIGECVARAAQECEAAWKVGGPEECRRRLCGPPIRPPLERVLTPTAARGGRG